MIGIMLYHMLGSCSTVTLNALEEIGLPYTDCGVALMRGEQRQPAFLKINAKGKVPVLLVDGRAITEAPVILYYRATRWPQAKLLPTSGDVTADLDYLSDLVWCADGLHHFVTTIFCPVTIAPNAADNVRATAIARLGAIAQGIETRLASRRYWYGDDWSIVDVFIAWVMATSAGGGFPLDDFPALSGMAWRSSGVRPTAGRWRGENKPLRATICRSRRTRKPLDNIVGHGIEVTAEPVGPAAPGGGQDAGRGGIVASPRTNLRPGLADPRSLHRHSSRFRPVVVAGRQSHG